MIAEVADGSKSGIAGTTKVRSALCLPRYPPQAVGLGLPVDEPVSKLDET